MLKRLLLAAAALVTLAGCTPAGAPSITTPEPSLSPSAPAVPPAPQLAVGDCTGPLASSVTSSTPIEAVSCDQEHAYEVFQVVPLTGDLLPSTDALQAIANNRCLPAFADYVGVAPEYSHYTSVFLVPDEKAWESPELRRITCLLGSSDGTLNASARNDTRLFPEIGECTGPQDVPVLELDLIDCDQKHYYEVYAEKEIDSDEAPDAKALTKLLNSVCVAEFAKFVGKKAAESRYEYTYFLADAELWANVKDRRLVCSVGSPEGGIEGTLKDAKK